MCHRGVAAPTAWLCGRATDQGAEAGEGLGAGSVEDPDAALLAVDKSGVVEHLHVVTDGGLGQVKRVVEVAAASLAALVRGHEGHQPQPDVQRMGTLDQAKLQAPLCAGEESGL